MVAMFTWVDFGVLLHCTALGRLLSRLSVTTTRFSGCKGYLHCGLALNWAGLAVFGSLTNGTSCTSTRFDAVLQWEW